MVNRGRDLESSTLLTTEASVMAVWEEEGDLGRAEDDVEDGLRSCCDEKD